MEVLDALDPTTQQVIDLVRRCASKCGPVARDWHSSRRIRRDWLSGFEIRHPPPHGFSGRASWEPALLSIRAGQCSARSSRAG